MSNLKRDAYNCYLRAKENPKIGCMKRLKKIVMETEYGTITTCTSENMSMNEGNCLAATLKALATL